MRNRRTEIDHLNGYVSRRGREHGVLTPINDTVIAETHRHGVGFTPSPKYLDPTAKLLPPEGVTPWPSRITRRASPFGSDPRDTIPTGGIDTWSTPSISSMETTFS